MSRLLTNLTYVTCLLAVCAELAQMSGFFSFVGRYIQTQYDVTPAVTSIILGRCNTSLGKGRIRDLWKVVGGGEGGIFENSNK